MSSKILNQPEYLSWARRAAERIWILAWDPKTGALQHEIFEGHPQTPGYLDDYALLGDGFMAMYDVTGEPIWEQRAMLLADSLLTRFRAGEWRLSQFTEERSPDLAGRQ